MGEIDVHIEFMASVGAQKIELKDASMMTWNGLSAWLGHWDIYMYSIWMQHINYPSSMTLTHTFYPLHLRHHI
jgi:hypothetical protein